MNDTHQANTPQTKRRGFFRRAGILASIAALAGGIGLHAHAQGVHGFHLGLFGGRMDAAQMEERMTRLLKHLYVEINATEEQKKKLDPVIKQALTDIEPLREQMRAVRTQAIGLLAAEQVDRAAIETMRAERMKAADAASRRISQALADIAEILTPAQRKELAARAQKTQQRRGPWHRS